MKKKVAFHTLGCKVNQYETEAIAESFISRGYEKVDFSQVADIYVINTCTVTNIADKKSRQMLSKAKKINKNAIVVAVGCYVQMEKENLCKDKDIDLIIGNTNKSKIVEYVEELILKKNNNNNTYIEDISSTTDYEELFISKVDGQTRVFVKIQDGCNQFCSYCIIPYTRGRVRSRKPELVINEIQELVNKGFKEIVLTGIHLASYGLEFDNYSLIDLLEDINKINGLMRIRLGSIEPNLIHLEFVNRLAKVDKICPHFHLSLQSGCNETLKRMNRKYTTEKYLDSVNLLRKFFVDPSITTDIIVGFPGETEEEFEKTKTFIKTVEFANLHIFKYSIRKGTKAANMKNQVNNKIKNLRSHQLIDLCNNLKRNYNKKFIGKKVEVLFEEIIEKESESYIIGLTTNYIKVAVKNDKNIKTNTIKEVEIIKDENDFLLGKII